MFAVCTLGRDSGGGPHDCDVCCVHTEVGFRRWLLCAHRGGIEEVATVCTPRWDLGGGYCVHTEVGFRRWLLCAH